MLGTGEKGLSETKVELERESSGTNVVNCNKEKSVSFRVIQAFVNPFTAILAVIAIVSVFTDWQLHK